MDVRIGITNSAREITFETELTVEKFMEQITDAIGKDQDFVALEDSKGTQWHVNAKAINYVEFGSSAGRRVGFVN